MLDILNAFTRPLLHWFDAYGRKDLPWQTPRTAYHVWISEIMLQQTQVKTVIPYFIRFIHRFPNVPTLAQATEDEVLALWSGLGYYSRGRNLQKAAILIMQRFAGEFPADPSALEALPGIGPSTAAAIASLAFNQPTAILDGNVKRVLSRYFLIAGDPTKAATLQTFMSRAKECMSRTRCADYTQAIMDLGATCCKPKNPRCEACPLSQTCLAHLQQVEAQYPQKTIKKRIPIKQEQFLVLHTREGFVYLEKRPSTGIWGGLWCLPSIPMEQPPSTYLDQTHRVVVKNILPLLQMKHTFSHFQLHIHALSVEVESRHQPAKQGCWFQASDLSSLGLATPVSRIVQYFLKVDNADCVASVGSV